MSTMGCPGCGGQRFINLSGVVIPCGVCGGRGYVPCPPRPVTAPYVPRVPPAPRLKTDEDIRREEAQRVDEEKLSHIFEAIQQNIDPNAHIDIQSIDYNPHKDLGKSSLAVKLRDVNGHESIFTVTKDNSSSSTFGDVAVAMMVAYAKVKKFKTNSIGIETAGTQEEQDRKLLTACKAFDENGLALSNTTKKRREEALEREDKRRRPTPPPPPPRAPTLLERMADLFR